MSVQPFKLVFYTKKAVRTYTASYDGAKYTNCRPTEDGGVVVFFDNHKLGIGALWVDVHVPLTDKDFSDGVCNYRSTEPTGIVLDKGVTDDLGGFEVDVFPFYKQGEDGKSAYDLWIEEGNEGTVADFLASLKGANGVDGANGKSAYQEWLDLGNEGTEEDFLESLKGKGADIVSSVDDLDPNAPQGSLAVVASSEEVTVKVSVRDSYIGNENPRIITELNVHEPTGEVVEIEGIAQLFIPKGYTPEQALSEGRVIALYTTPDVLVCELVNGGDGDHVELWRTDVGVDKDKVEIVNDLIDTFGGVFYVGNADPESGAFFEPTEQSINSLDAFLAYDEVQTINETTLYIKEAEGWEEFKNGSEVVNNLEEGGADKALSAEMGKLLNEKIANIVAGNTTEPIKFKGYVNVDNKNGIDAMFGLLSEGEACLVAPSVDTGSGDSYKAWVSSAINQEQIELSTELFKTSHNITVSNVLSGRPLEVKTFLKLDEAQPYCQCPDMILLCKIKVKAKDFVEFVDGISSSIASVIPDSLMLTACIGKVLRWSAGDWLLNNPDKYSLTHKYEPYNTNPSGAWETGIIAYTLVGGPISGERFTIIVNASSDTDANGNITAHQIAYGRTGVAEGRVWTRVGFSNVGWQPWVEISNDKNILPNVNGWLLNPDEQLATGVYQTCNSLRVQSNDSYPFHNNYFTMFVNASTSPNGDGWDAIEQTAYGREGDEGKIYRRVISLNKTTNEKQYKEWRRIDDGGSINESNIDEFLLSIMAGVEEMIANSITNTLNTEV